MKGAVPALGIIGSMATKGPSAQKYKLFRFLDLDEKPCHNKRINRGTFGGTLGNTLGNTLGSTLGGTLDNPARYSNHAFFVFLTNKAAIFPSNFFSSQ